MKRRVIIIGAGAAGLTAAYEILSKDPSFEVIILEESNAVGGIARAVKHNGNLMDVGGHRFFTDIPEIEKWWISMMPLLKCKRLSRIYFNRRFFNYPVKLNFTTVKNMGVKNFCKVCGSFLKSRIIRRPVDSLEDYYINQFGEKMYRMFFERYTENLWGRHPREILPEYGKERVNDKISILSLLSSVFHKKEDVFWYPKLGPGQMWETVASKVEAMGGKIMFNAKAVEIERDSKNLVSSVIYKKDGRKRKTKCDYVISSMPVKDLVPALTPVVPKRYEKIAAGLPYRDYVIIGILVSKLTKDVQDDWIYVHDKDVKMGRIQVYNNWSPYLVKDKSKMWLGLEYFCNEGDELWRMSDGDFCKMAASELAKLGLTSDTSEVLDFHVERQKKAYPAYFDTYKQFGELRKYLDKIPNLFLVGRNGQHRYNNIDHSMLSAVIAAKKILNGDTDKAEIWDVNTEEEYHEKR